MKPDIDGVMTLPLILYGKVNQCFDHVNGVQHPLSFQKKKDTGRSIVDSPDGLG